MTRSEFDRLLMVTKDALEYLEYYPEGDTLRGLSRYIKDLLSRHGLDREAHPFYVSIVLSILETAGVVSRVMTRGVPTILKARIEDENDRKAEERSAEENRNQGTVLGVGKVH